MISPLYPQPLAGRPVTLTANAQTDASATYGINPQGSVTFVIDGTAVATVPLSFYGYPPGGIATYTTDTLTAGNHTVVAYYAGDYAASNSSTVPLSVGPAPTTYIATGSSPGTDPRVNIYSPTGTLLASFDAFDPAFRGGVTVAVGDVNGDGTADIIVGAGPGGGPQVIVVDGTKLSQVKANGQIAPSALLASFYAYDAGFAGGVFVAVGKLDSLPGLDIVTGAGAGGGPHVRTFSVSTGTGTQIAGPLGSFYAYAQGFTGGVHVAVGDVLVTGSEQIVTGAGAGGGPEVRVFDQTGALARAFYAFDQNFSGGVWVTATTGVIGTGAGAGGGPEVRSFRGTDLAVLIDYYAYNPDFRGGVRVGLRNDLVPGSIEGFTGAGPGGGPHVKVYNEAASEIESFFAFDAAFDGGVYVG